MLVVLTFRWWRHAAKACAMSTGDRTVTSHSRIAEVVRAQMRKQRCSMAGPCRCLACLFCSLLSPVLAMNACSSRVYKASIHAGSMLAILENIISRRRKALCMKSSRQVDKHMCRQVYKNLFKLEDMLQHTGSLQHCCSPAAPSAGSSTSIGPV